MNIKIINAAILGRSGKRRFFVPLISAAVALLALSGATSARADEAVQHAHELVIAGHPSAVKLGLDVLNQGGNAADAFVTVSLALGVGEPGNSGLGGKMVCLYYDAKTKTVSCVVAMDAAPQHVDVKGLLAIPDAQRERGWPSTCTPGLIAGLNEIHKHFATMPWKSLVLPAADLAANGVTVNARMAEMCSQFPIGVDAAADAIYAPNQKTLAQGATLKNPDLAATLRTIATDGAQAFYKGPIADRLVAAAQAHGGYLSKEDLANYHARFLPPLSGHFKDYTVYTSPPPLSGGTTLLTALDVLDKLHWPATQPRDVNYVDAVSRVMQQVYPQVSKAAGDAPDSLERVDKLLTPINIAGLADKAEHAKPQEPYAKAKAAAASGDLIPAEATSTRAFTNVQTDDFQTEDTWDNSDQASTTHLLIIDKMGNIICCTQSLGLHFGAGVIAPGDGFLMNADIGNFNLTQADSINALAPGKWPRSTMAPTIFIKDGKPVLVIGSPAGQRIPTAVLQVALDVLDFDRPLQQAIDAPRFHIRSSTSKTGPNKIDLEPTAPATLDAALKARGWDVERHAANDFYFGSVNAAVLYEGTIEGVADQRRTSDAGGG
jgi:gamma-glutamyltranspeptidase/glutathione hydrolase